MHVELDIVAAQVLRKKLLDRQTGLGIVMVPRHINDAGIEPSVWIAVDENAKALTLLQMQDAHGRGVELVIGDLEQQIARKSLQYVNHCLGGVTAARIARLRNDSRNLLP